MVVELPYIKKRKSSDSNAGEAVGNIDFLIFAIMSNFDLYPFAKIATGHIKALSLNDYKLLSNGA